MLEPKPANISTAIKVRTRISFLVGSFAIFITWLEIGLLMVQFSAQMGHRI